MNHQPIPIIHFKEWFTRRLNACGPDGVTDQVAMAEEVMRWTEQQHSISFSEEQASRQPSPTAGMNIAQRILHVGGRNNAAGYVEFGSTQAVEALVRQVLRDLPAQSSLTDEQIWANEKIMAANADAGLPFDKLAKIVRAVLATQAAQPGYDSMGIPKSCGGALCRTDEHHPLCKQAAQPELQRRFDELLRVEHALSESYVRVREIIGAMNPPALEAEALYAYVEDCARKLAAQPEQPAQTYPACKGRNCGATDGRSHSPECIAEHDQAAQPVQDQGVPEDVKRAQIIEKAAQSFKNDTTHLGQRVYVNDLVWALGVLAAAPQVEHGVYVGLAQRLMTLSTRLGISCGDSVEHFNAALENNLYAICRGVERLLAAPQAAPQQAEPNSPAPDAGQIIKLGSYGSAFDLAGDRRAYTYKHQPNNVTAWQIGDASSRAEAGGDLIDRGLSLLKALEAQGFGVFDLAGIGTKGAK